MCFCFLTNFLLIGLLNSKQKGMKGFPRSVDWRNTAMENPVAWLNSRFDCAVNGLNVRLAIHDVDWDAWHSGLFRLRANLLPF
jgi:hypothetical protein